MNSCVRHKLHEEPEQVCGYPSKFLQRKHIIEKLTGNFIYLRGCLGFFFPIFPNAICFSLLASIWVFVLFVLFTEKAISIVSVLFLRKSAISDVSSPYSLAIDITTADWSIDAHLYIYIFGKLEWMTHGVNASPAVIERSSVQNCLLEQQDDRYWYWRILRILFCQSCCCSA